MYFGEHFHSLDEKGRGRIPAKLKSALGANFVMTKGTSGCLFVFNKNYFELEFLNKLKSVPTFSDKQKSVRAFLSSTYDIEEDGQGRFLLPVALREFAGISKNITFIGVGNRIEVWSQTAWNKYNETYDFDEVALSLSEFDI